MQIAMPPITVGWIIALLVLILAIVLIVVSQVPLIIGLLIAGVALSRLL